MKVVYINTYVGKKRIVVSDDIVDYNKVTDWSTSPDWFCKCSKCGNISLHAVMQGNGNNKGETIRGECYHCGYKYEDKINE